MKYIKSNVNFSNKINEDIDGGPFANGIKWGDSLIGRLFNSAARKAKIQVNLGRISNLKELLMSEFDYLLEEAKLNSLPTDTKENVNKTEISFLLGELNEAVQNKTDDTNIKEHIDLLKSKSLYIIKKIKESNDINDENLEKQLNDFINELDKHKIDEPEEKKKDKSEDINIEKLDKNFKDILRIVSTYNDILKERKLKNKSKEVEPEKEQEISSIKKDISSIEDKLKDPNISDQAKEELKKELTKKHSKKKELVTDSYKFLENKSTNSNSLKIVKSIWSLLSTEIKKSDWDIEKLLKITPEKVGEYKDFLIRLYKPLLTTNESVFNLDQKLQKQIQSLFKSTNDIPQEYSELKKAVDDFKISLNSIIKNNEKRIFNYKKFKIIRESKSETIIESIKTWFNKNMNFSNYTVTEKMGKELIEKTNQVNEDELVISVDRIIEIVNIFNRAYKVYTKNVIPSGRSGGKVSASVFNEYTYLGQGTPGSPDNPGYGPWRNDKLFNSFEEAVFEIFKEEKYQPIFKETTKIIDDKGNEKQVEGGGKILAKFMNSLIDGNTLYRSGAQQKFFSQYFGYEIGKDELNTPSFENKDGKEVNIGDETREPVEAMWIEDNKDIELKSGLIYGVSIKKVFHYLLIHEIKEDKVYFKWSANTNTLNNMLSDVIKGKIDRGNLVSKPSSEGDIFYIEAKKDDFRQIFKRDISVISLNISDFSKRSDTEAEKIKLKRNTKFKIVNKEDKTPIVSNRFHSGSPTGENGNEFNKYREKIKKKR